MSKVTRPLSPHLSIYRPQITTVLSITHRFTGIALYLGTLLLIAFLCVAAYSPANYVSLHGCLSSIPGQVVLFGWTLSFYFHLFNGIRHLFWDIGKGFELPTAYKSGWTVVILSLLASVASWAIAYSNAGVL